MIGGVPVPLYLDMEKEKEEKKSTEKKGWSALLNFDNQGKRRKMTRTGTVDNSCSYLQYVLIYPFQTAFFILRDFFQLVI
jgi:hypothetical protein